VINKARKKEGRLIGKKELRKGRKMEEKDKKQSFLAKLRE
jgi:hypothetical protein